MLEFVRRYSVFLASFFFLSLSLALLSANRSGARRIDPLGAIFLEALQPLQSITTSLAQRVRGVWTGYVALVGVSDENRRLREELIRLDAERHRWREIEFRNSRLEQLLDFRSHVPAKVLTARITGRDASEWFESFSLDRGDRDGIRSGMAVVAAEGVVGRVSQTSPNVARVLLVADHNSGVDALVQRTRARGIVEGSIAGICSMKYIRHDEHIEAGDQIVTSGLDGLFPKGLVIGHVVDVTRGDYGLFQTAEVQPAVDFSKLEEVLILTSPPEQVNAELAAKEAAAAFVGPPEPPAAPAVSSPPSVR